jgi:hypothetical protein
MSKELWISAEQESNLLDAWGLVDEYPDSPYRLVRSVPAIQQGRLEYNYVTVSDGDLYDGPGAKSEPGTVLALIGPIHDRDTISSLEQTVTLLRSLGHVVHQTGEH